jgi:hypothetical protein
MREDVATIVAVFSSRPRRLKAFDRRDRKGTAKSAKKIFRNKHKRRRFLDGAVHFKS